MKAASDDLNIDQSSLNNWVQSAKSKVSLVEHRGLSCINIGVYICL